MNNCVNCQISFELTDQDQKVLTKMRVPEPSHCPPCRAQRRFTFRNDQNYYKNACHLCQKTVVSTYSPDKPIPVLCPDCFWSDSWDPLSYGVDFDFSRPFLEQFAEMRQGVPRLAIFNTQSENSEYTVHSSKNRNCYMASSLATCEEVHFSDWVMNSTDSIDLLMCTQMQMCYECMFSHECFHSNYLELCNSVSESFFAFDCRNSKRLVGCVGLRSRKNHILNRPASKEECLVIIQKLKTDRAFFGEFKQKYNELKQSLPVRDAWMVNAENCSGNYIVNSKNATQAFHVVNNEDTRYSWETNRVKDGYDVSRQAGSEMVYECTSGVDLRFSKFCNMVYQSDNMGYCDNVQNSSHCFGSVGLKSGRFVILNKQYTESEYRELIPKIIEHMKKTGEWGEYFPVTLSPYGYNETKANELFPMSREQVEQKGWKWSDYEVQLDPGLKKIPAERLPDDIKDIPDDILNWAILSKGDGSAFRLTSAELKFYRKKGLPVPQLSPKERHRERLKLQSPRHLYSRACAECQNPIQTTYAPERPEKVVCEHCYLKNIY
ncbi:hypothetical protein IPJ72_05770 [Candidatus Peregrinibacteria bacterium]|nr:MAG: hypothetical protein IPJ72_05770 [Candidatus Peregrinibacteria bacterium]